MWLEAGRSICWGLQPGKLLRPEWSAGLRGAGPEMVEEMGERVKGGSLRSAPLNTGSGQIAQLLTTTRLMTRLQRAHGGERSATIRDFDSLSLLASRFMAAESWLSLLKQV